MVDSNKSAPDLDIPVDKPRLISALELKIAQLKRGRNAAAEPEFKEVYELQLSQYESLLTKVRTL
jgi:hypothetical protein